ncbi:hypothetical protein QTO34_014152 [Cnephaeus nilssonii]|uniref:Uncharacterized protein n=1 Tax=Cnephaeus nilssonii TaxID=3371016 RepID=A0AA40HAA4_CNENI|nr:hypothetical protein QTO34_014152 [Eptesicus nilssonii]
MEKPAPVPEAGCSPGDGEAAHPAVLGTSTCGWLQPGRWRSRPPCGPGPQYLWLAVAWETEKPPTLRSWAPVPVAGCGLGDREATHPADLGTSNCGWLWPGRQRSRSPCGPGASTCSWLQHGRWRIRPPCSPGHQHLWLAVAWETKKPPTLQSWVPALAAAAQAKPPVHHPLRLQPAWAPMADQRERSPDPGCLWSAGGGNPGYQVSPERQNLKKVLEILGQVSLERQNLQKVLEILGQVSPERQNLQKMLEILGQVSLERQNLQKMHVILGQVSLERQNLQNVLEILSQMTGSRPFQMHLIAIGFSARHTKAFSLKSPAALAPSSKLNLSLLALWPDAVFSSLPMVQWGQAERMLQAERSLGGAEAPPSLMMLNKPQTHPAQQGCCLLGLLLLTTSGLKPRPETTEKAILFQKFQRQMEPLGAWPRTLTREAREQIRYLHEGFPESWSLGCAGVQMCVD